MGISKWENELKETRDLLRIAPALFGFVDLDGKILDLNDLSLEIIQASRNEVLGQLIWNAPWWKDLSKPSLQVKEAVEKAAQGSASQFETEYTATIKNVKKTRWVTLSVNPFRDKTGNITRISVSGVDITDLKRIEADLRKSRDQLSRAVQVSKIGFYDWNIVENRMLFSEQMKEDWGITNLTTLEDAAAFIHPDDREKTLELVEVSMKNHEKYDTNYRVVRPDGKVIWIHAQGEVLYDEKGNPIRFFGTSLDITERREIEIALMESRKLIMATKDEMENERKNFYTLFRQVPEMVCVLAGPDHVFEFVNEAHIKALGFNAIGMAVRIAQPESIEVHGILDEVYRTGKTAELREIAVTLKDRIRYFNLTYSARKDALGKINGIMILGAEVTDIVEARRILESNEQSLQQFLNAVPATLWSTRPEGKIDFLNRFWFVSSGEDPTKDKQFNHWFETIHPEDRASVFEHWKEAVEKKEIIDHEFRIWSTTTKSYRWHRSRGTPLRNEQGKIFRWAGYFSDVHEEKQALEKLTDERELREKFVATLSHDLRTPLTAAKMSAQMLIRRANDPIAAQKSATRVLENLDRAHQMIRDLLDANRIKAGEKIPIATQACDIKKILSHTIEELSTVHGDRFSVNAKNSVEGQWDPEGIRRILENLCDNAVKYGNAHSLITLNLSKKGKSILLEIHNEGKPIAEKDLENLFAPYSRAESASGKKGWGLGLSLVKAITEAHGGEVTVESSVKKGTTFRVELPSTSIL